MSFVSELHILSLFPTLILLVGKTKEVLTGPEEGVEVFGGGNIHLVQPTSGFDVVERR